MLKHGELLRRSCRVRELPGRFDAFEVSRLWGDSAHRVLLESTDTERGRWSFLGIEPFLSFRSKRSECWAGAPGQECRLSQAPLAALVDLLERFRLPLDDDVVAQVVSEIPFRGGAMGYLGYELLYLLEDIPDLGREDRPVPDCYLLFFEALVAFDLREGRQYVVANAFAPTIEQARQEAERRLSAIVDRVRTAEHVGIFDRTPPVARDHRRISEEDLASRGIVPVIPRADYLNVVERAKEDIRDGYIFEVCTCNRFDTTYRGSGEDLYSALRRVSPAPFSAHIRVPEVEVLSSSPERFLRLDRNRWVETRPMKGTRPRGRSPDEDRALYLDLLNSEKDRAENVMIVDLARNDLGRVCEFRTITVPDLQVIESFAFTHQMVSTVRGRLEPQYTPIDLLAAAFPGGSMTGAPKVEAMKIIDRLEPVKRGIFSGSIGYIDFDGAFDFSIVIRTLIKQGNDLSFHVGGAIVSDSNAAEEHQEILDKAAGMVAALDLEDVDR